MNELITAFWPYYLIIFALAVIFGFTAQRSAFCPVGGLREWVNERRAGRLATYFGAIAVAILFAALVEGFGWFNLSQTIPPYRTTEFAWGRYILGGFIFGFGMVLAAGCGMRNLVRVGQGSIKAVWLVMIMALVAYLMTRTSFYAEWVMPWISPLSLQFTDSGAQDFASLVMGQTESLSTWRMVLGVIIGGALFILLLRLKEFRQLYPLMTAFVIGGVIVGAYALTGGSYAQFVQEEGYFMDIPPAGLGTQSFTFAAPMGDVVHWLSEPQWALVSFGVIAVFGLVVGSLIAAVSFKQFKLEGFASSQDFWRSSLGAVMVGFGAVLAMGCSIGHGLSGMATLALGSMVALAAILTGAYVGIRFDSRTR
ncbi:YeeE/YedE family protein [Thiomicrorhabdus sp. 6S2-11]|uniref:YeeE/YedE family protein n=1 Tax=Thiomicrorhabdus marina TaxID=2818442 RepID=A0ABS3Q1I4_9GAMM|nr:YeeE/YedE family protein [Thiomicrorhabdus marina]MBO1926174.1 YeeE/YedE family protein [Thiomicrorhabdus marina]